MYRGSWVRGYAVPDDSRLQQRMQRAVEEKRRRESKGRWRPQISKEQEERREAIAIARTGEEARPSHCHQTKPAGKGCDECGDVCNGVQGNSAGREA